MYFVWSLDFCQLQWLLTNVSANAACCCHFCFSNVPFKKTSILNKGSCSENVWSPVSMLATSSSAANFPFHLFDYKHGWSSEATYKVCFRGAFTKEHSGLFYLEIRYSSVFTTERNRMDSMVPLSLNRFCRVWKTQNTTTCWWKQRRWYLDTWRCDIAEFSPNLLGAADGQVPNEHRPLPLLAFLLLSGPHPLPLHHPVLNPLLSTPTIHHFTLLLLHHRHFTPLLVLICDL